MRAPVHAQKSLGMQSVGMQSVGMHAQKSVGMPLAAAMPRSSSVSC